MLRLTGIGVGGFKSIKDLQNLDIRPINILIGANGSGKSNLFSFFRLLNALAHERLNGFVGLAGKAGSLLHYGPKVTPALWTQVRFEHAKTGGGRYWTWLSFAETDQMVFQDEAVWYPYTRNDDPRKVSLGSGHTESRLPTRSDDPVAGVRTLFAGIQAFHFHDTAASSQIRRHINIEDGQALHADGGNLAAVLLRLKNRQPKYYTRIVDTIRLVAPFFDDFVLLPSVDNNELLRLDWKDRDSDHRFGAHQLSDGTLRAMALITLLQQPEDDLPGCILLDEPELGMHPYAIQVVASLIQSASVHRPVFVATQSAALVNHFAPEDIVVVTRTEGQSRFKRPDAESLKVWLEDYAVGELWHKNVIGGNPTR